MKPFLSPLHTFCLTVSESHVFATLSGDFNPLHLDPVTARRLKYGGPVVHGMHVCLQLLNLLLIGRVAPLMLAHIKAQFYGPVRVDEEITVVTHPTDSRHGKWTLRQREQRVMSIVLTWDLAVNTPVLPLPVATLPPHTCVERNFEELQSTSGSLLLALERTLLQHAFPGLVALPALQVAILCAATRLVGMECPGLHSLFAGFEFSFHPVAPDADLRLHYQVSEWDPRFSRIIMALQGAGVTGSVESFLRSAPVIQPSYATICAFAEPTLCLGHHALIIGGSRGLGEVMAKLIAASGGHTVITYQAGQADAQRVAEEIRAGKGVCDILAWDVLAPQGMPEHGAARAFTHLYYFASPHIEFNPWVPWQESLFQHYIAYYVTGLCDTVATLLSGRAKGSEPLTVFYPSSVFLDQPELGAWEYAAAKAAGEAVCLYLTTYEPRTRCFYPRLVRMRTDQTGESIGIDVREPLEELLPILGKIAHN